MLILAVCHERAISLVEASLERYSFGDLDGPPLDVRGGWVFCWLCQTKHSLVMIRFLVQVRVIGVDRKRVPNGGEVNSLVNFIELIVLCEEICSLNRSHSSYDCQRPHNVMREMELLSEHLVTGVLRIQRIAIRGITVPRFGKWSKSVYLNGTTCQFVSS